MNSFASFFVPIRFSSIYTDIVFGYILFSNQMEERMIILNNV